MKCLKINSPFIPLLWGIAVLRPRIRDKEEMSDLGFKLL
jgi:hypothetical protein